MTILSIDIETYSPIELKTHGVYKYVEAPDLKYPFSYASLMMIRSRPLTSPKKASSIYYRTLLINPEIIKTAYNANFERVCLSKYL